MRRVITIEDFCRESLLTSQKKKINFVILIIWYHQTVFRKMSISCREINNYLISIHLPAYRTRLINDLKSDKRITVGDKGIGYKLNRIELERLDTKYLYLFESEIEIKERVSLNKTPFIDLDDISNGQTMSQLYLIVHCFENSVRNL